MNYNDWDNQDVVNCQDCPASAVDTCQACPVDCHNCSSCAPNCDLCNTDCQKCKTGPCQPSCDRCLSSTCKPDCTKCAQSCTLDCARFEDCPLNYKQCKIVGEGLSFNLVDFALYDKVFRVYNVKVTVITNQSQGHLFTLVNSDSIISLYLINKYLKVYANLTNKEVTYVTWGAHGQVQPLAPTSIYLGLSNSTMLSLAVNYSQFSVPVSTFDTDQRFSVYLGGLPAGLRGRAYPPDNTYMGLTGCLTDLWVNKSQTPQEFILQGAQVGCPRKFIQLEELPDS